MTMDICPELRLKFGWYPCLAPLEKTVMTALVAIRTGGMVDFVLKSWFDAAWVAAGGVVDDPRYKNFIFVYYLRLEIIGEEPDELEVYMLDAPFWFAVLISMGCGCFNVADTCFIKDYGK